MNKLYPHDKKECLLVDYKHFHKERIFQITKIHHTI